MECCEVRVPTYKRPEWLRRALQSLVAQDYSEWVALVMDDSLQQEGKAVVEAIADARIRYMPNAVNLGCAGNINQAFASHGLVAGRYACILEDDNWLMPTFISENIRLLETHGMDLLLRNQAVWMQEANFGATTGRTTRGDWFPEQIYTPLQLHAHLFFFEGIANGGLFWKTTVRSNLQVNSQVIDAGLQEYCRTLQIQDNFYFAAEPLCYWSEMPLNLSLRNSVENRIFGRGVQSIKQCLIQRYGKAIILEANKIACRLEKQCEFEVSLLDGLYTQYAFQQTGWLQKWQRYSKSYAKFKLIADPLNSYLEVAQVG
jgi:glycosyltransferase involved in cell wall biosynthesis